MQALADWGDRIDAIHIKDVRLDVLAGVKADARRHAHRLAPRAVLRARRGRRGPRRVLPRRRGDGYDGWVVVEQDRVLADGGRLRRAAADQVANREWLREHAGW